MIKRSRRSPTYLRRGACHWFVSTSVTAGSNVPLDTATSRTLEIPPKHCFGDASRRGKRECFFASFFQKKEGLFLAPCNGLLLYRTNRTKDINKLSHCPYGIGFNNAGKAVPLLCGKWSCEKCRVVLAKQWAWRASLHITNTNSQAYFWTLTLRSDIRTAYQGFRVIPKSWDSLRKTMQRKTGKWSYLAFVECHPKRSHIPHFHVLSLTPSPVVGSHIAKPIKDLAYNSGFGYMATEELVASWKAAWYVAKYASKHDSSIPRNFRRCRSSRDWAKLPEQTLPAYMVKSKAEHLWEFIQRVSDCSGVVQETLLLRWRVACNIYEVGYTEDE